VLYILDSGLRRNDEGLLDCLVTRHPPGKEPGSDRGDLHPPSVPPLEGEKKDMIGFVACSGIPSMRQGDLPGFAAGMTKDYWIAWSPGTRDL